MQGSGGCSSVGRVQDCDSCCRGFEPHQPPHYLKSARHWYAGFFLWRHAAIRSAERPGVTIETSTLSMCGKIQTLVACFKLFAGHSIQRALAKFLRRPPFTTGMHLFQTLSLFASAGRALIRLPAMSLAAVLGAAGAHAADTWLTVTGDPAEFREPLCSGQRGRHRHQG